jgi:hypothetical protein
MLVLVAIALSLTTSCGGGGNSITDLGNGDVSRDLLPEVPDGIIADQDAGDSSRDSETTRDTIPTDGTSSEGISDGIDDPGDIGDVPVAENPLGGEDVTDGEIIEGCPGQFLCPCTTFADCYQEFCVPTMDGAVCSKPCGPGIACPQGWTCDQVSVGIEKRFFCINPFPNLCRPCQADQDCVPSTGAMNRRFLCIDNGQNGKFCGSPCETSRDCTNYQGQTFDCVPVATSGGEVKQCRPTNGECPCTKKFKDDGYTTECYSENIFGKCVATRTCDKPCTAHSPSAESCNLQDDNCNGSTDELIAAIECDLPVNQWGSCKGKAYCNNGSIENCQGTNASADGPDGGISTCNGVDDDCDGTTDEGFPDTDSDGSMDCVDPDIDGDGVANALDNCPNVWNTDQANNDDSDELPGQKKGDACDDDDDNDTILDGLDNCPFVKNPLQSDVDGDRIGDACDCDADKDGIPNTADLDMRGGKCPDPGLSKDNCPLVLNVDQLDTDLDLQGDACDCDVDGDEVFNGNPGCVTPEKPDNCRTIVNPLQTDTDLDLIGDACDCDIDNDKVLNNNPGCAVLVTPDNCIYVPNADQADTNGNKIGDACDCDIDSDGYFNANPGCPACSPCDNCPYTANPGQEITLGGPEGDACKNDWDSDGIPNDTDNCPRKWNQDQADLDLDQIGDVCDCDIDEDGFGNDGIDKLGASCPTPDPLDNCPRIANSSQSDLDGNHIGDACDCDIDGDGDPQPNFECPTPVDPDCEPENPAVSNLVSEVCANNIDDNCNGFIDEEGGTFCQDFYYDEDDDKFGTPQSKCLCKATLNWRAPVGTDCNDKDASINPGAQEICNNGRDDNCNGSENDLNALNCTRYYFDSDVDNYGTGDFECRCYPAGGQYTARFTNDCKDDDPNINPGKTEVCNNGIDDNCINGQNDENGTNCHWYYYDGDADTYGTASSKCFCFENATLFFTATKPGDCNDENSKVNPAMREVCNSDNIDYNCDGFLNTDGADGCLNYYYDGDRDGYGRDGDFRCQCASRGDYLAPESGDCQDANPNINPGVAEVCDGIDNNCDGRRDENPTALCGTVPHGTTICRSTATCDVDLCDQWFNNVDPFWQNGCECEADANDQAQQGDTCSNAIPLGPLWDQGGALPLVSGRIVPGSDEDWYSVQAMDSVDSGSFAAPGHNLFNLVVEMKSPVGGTLKVEVRRGGCTTTGTTCGGTVFQWKADKEEDCVTKPPVPEIPEYLWGCCGSGQCESKTDILVPPVFPPEVFTPESACCNNVAQCTDSRAVHHCGDNGETFFIRVYRDSTFPASTSCSQLDYLLEISNGRVTLAAI